jgi:hypothetical protein
VADWKKLLDDAVSTIGDGVSAAGDGLRELADDARKVAGLGRGSIEIVPDRARHRLGDTIEGTLKVTLDEPVAARRLVVALRAHRRRNALGAIAARARDAGPREEMMFEFECNVAGEGTFESGEHRFAIDIPTEIDASVQAGGLLGDALRAVKTVDSLTHGQLRWRLTAFLDIPWKRNLSNAIDIAVREDAPDIDDEEDPPPRPSPPQPPRKPKPEPTRASTPPPAAPSPAPAPGAAPAPAPSPAPAPPRSTPPATFAAELDRTLDDLRRRGFVVIHEHRSPPVDPSIVMQALARHPDLDAELLHFYAVMDGLEIVVGQPRFAATRYDTLDAAQDAAARSQGAIGSLDALLVHDEIGPALVREFCEDTVCVLAILPLARLLDDAQHFPHRDGRNVVFAAAILRAGDVFGLIHADEIRSWRQPAAGQPARPGCFDHHAEASQAHLREREATHRASWWIVRGRDHGTSLREPPLLRWSEMLAACLDHLQGR